MSRFSDAPYGVRALLGALLAATMIISGAPAASAEPTPPVVEAPGSDEQGSSADAPVIDIVAPILDLQISTSDKENQARLEEDPEETKVTVDSTVAFGKDSAVLRPKAKKRLAEIATTLKDKGAGSLAVVGYTDDLGSAEHGQVLSEKRAKAVSTVLKKSLPSKDFSFTVKGKGEADPAVPNDSEANRRINRRVEITYRSS